MTAPTQPGAVTAIAALPATLRALADALDDLLTIAESARPAPVAASCARRLAVVPEPDEPERLCRWCRHPLLPGMRIDAEYCTSGCRMAAWRRRTGRS